MDSNNNFGLVDDSDFINNLINENSQIPSIWYYNQRNNNYIQLWEFNTPQDDWVEVTQLVKPFPEIYA